MNIKQYLLILKRVLFALIAASFPTFGIIEDSLKFGVFIAAIIALLTSLYFTVIYYILYIPCNLERERKIYWLIQEYLAMFSGNILAFLILSIAINGADQQIKDIADYNYYLFGLYLIIEIFLFRCTSTESKN